MRDLLLVAEIYVEKDDGQVNALLKDDNEMDRQGSMSNDFKFKKMLLHFRQVEKKRDEDTERYAWMKNCKRNKILCTTIR